jgi:hypothetical protein
VIDWAARLENPERPVELPVLPEDAELVEPRAPQQLQGVPLVTARVALGDLLQ